MKQGLSIYVGNRVKNLEEIQAKFNEERRRIEKAMEASDEKKARTVMCTLYEKQLAGLKEEERLRVIEQKKYLQSRECVNPNCTK